MKSGSGDPGRDQLDQYDNDREGDCLGHAERNAMCRWTLVMLLTVVAHEGRLARDRKTVPPTNTIKVAPIHRKKTSAPLTMLILEPPIQGKSPLI